MINWANGGHGKSACIAAWMIGQLCLAANVPVALTSSEPESLVCERIQENEFASEVFDRTTKFTVIYPDGYREEDKTWPVVFVLHGLGRNHQTLIEDDFTRKALLKANFVSILPDGEKGWYVNSTINPQSRYEDYLIEVVNHAQKSYALTNDRNKRGIAGWSMGGYGAALFSGKHPGDFGNLVTIIGLLDFPRNDFPEGQGFSIPQKVFGDDPKEWRSINPMHYAANLGQTKMLILTGSDAFDLTMNRNFIEKLKALGIHHTYIEFEGGHTFPSVRKGIQLMVRFFNEEFVDEDPKSISSSSR